MRIRKNTKLSSMLLATAGYGGEIPETYTCHLNQSPWDVIPVSSFGDGELTNLLDSSWFLPSPSSSSSPPLIHKVIQFISICYFISISFPWMPSISSIFLRPLLGFLFVFSSAVRETWKNPKIMDFGILGRLFYRFGLMGRCYFALMIPISFSVSDYSFSYYKVSPFLPLTQFNGDDSFNGNVTLADCNGAAER